MNLPQTMKAIVFSSPGKWELKQVPVPGIQEPDRVLLEIEAAGICGTDVHILADPPGHPGTVGAVLGHEFVGKVIETGDAVTSLKVNDRVAVDPNITCGACAACQDGFHNMCREMTTLGIFQDGGFAKYATAPAKQCFVLPENLDPAKAAFTEPLSCVLNGVRRLDPQFGESALVLGAGPIGLLFALSLKASGLGDVVVIEPNEFRRGVAMDCGATAALDPGAVGFNNEMSKILPKGADIVVDAVGSLLAEAVSGSIPGGRILLFGQNTKARCDELCQNDITRKELTVMGSYIAKHTFPQAIRLLSQGTIDPEPLITMRLPLDRFGEGLLAMQEGRAIKVIVEP